MRKGAVYHHGDLRRALVDVTIDLVDRYGAEGFTLRAAAKRAGVSDAAPYHHFANKEALLAEVAQDGFRTLCDEMLKAADATQADARKKGEAMGVAYVSFAVRHPERFRLMFGPMLQAPQRHPELARAAERACSLMQHVMTGEHHGSDRRAMPRHVRCGLWALVHGLSVLAIDGRLGVDATDARSLSRLARSALESFDRGERPGTEAEPGPKSDRRVRRDRLDAARRGVAELAVARSASARR